MKKQHQFNSFSDVMENIFNGFEEINTGNMGRFPAANIRETNESFMIDLIVPGRTKEDIRIHQEKDKLVVSSEVEKNNEGETYRRTEFKLSPFKRSFLLPKTADSETITASYLNGILTISIGKKEEARIEREITIN